MKNSFFFQKKKNSNNNNNPTDVHIHPLSSIHRPEIKSDAPTVRYYNRRAHNIPLYREALRSPPRGFRTSVSSLITFKCLISLCLCWVSGGRRRGPAGGTLCGDLPPSGRGAVPPGQVRLFAVLCCL